MSDSRLDAAAPLPGPALLEGWLRAFTNRTQPHAVQQADGTYRWVYEECTAQVLAAHLAGAVTLALSSTDARGWCRWACLDVDVPGGLPQLLAVRDALAEPGLPGLVVGSRRGGHLWLLLDEAVPATALRYAVRAALAEISAAGVEVPAHELYPDTGAAGALGHAVRLPLGIHRKTGRRYPPYDADGLPCVFTSHERAAAFVLEAAPRIPAALVRIRWEAFLAGKGAHGGRVGEASISGDAAGAQRPARRPPGSAARDGGPRVGARSAVIRWVDARVSPLDLLAELAPDTELRKVGRGYLGWCPFHDDRAADMAGLPGTPSFYAVNDRRCGWSWRCLSTNCEHGTGPMRHSFRLLQELLELSVAAAILEALHRWPEIERRALRSRARIRTKERQRVTTPVSNTSATTITTNPPVDEADGVLDELQAWFLGKAQREGWVYTSVLRQPVNRLYRDRDYLNKRQRQGKKTAYDYAVDRDMKALAWAIRALVRHTPPEEKQRAEPPSRRGSRPSDSPHASGSSTRASPAGTASPSAIGRDRTFRRSSRSSH